MAGEYWPERTAKRLICTEIPSYRTSVPSSTVFIPTGGGNTAPWPQSQQGWQCPCCQYVWAPGIAGCSNCNRPAWQKQALGTTATFPVTPADSEGEQGS